MRMDFKKSMICLIIFAMAFSGFNFSLAPLSHAADSQVSQGDGLVNMGDYVKVNQVGYLLNYPKRAVVVTDDVYGTNKFHVVDVYTNEAVHTGVLGAPVEDPSSGDTIREADFSSYNVAGTYMLWVEGAGFSYPFRIGRDVYHQSFLDTARSYTLGRASVEMDDPITGLRHGLGHPQDEEAKMYFSDAYRQAGEALDVSGGWYDAGDYGKYIPPAAVTVAQLLLAYELEPDKYYKGQFMIPVGLSEEDRQTDMPDVLVEVKAELDWMMKMQRPDGAVYHKVGGKDFPGMTIAPELDTQERYVYGLSTYGTAMFAASFAMASRAYESYDADYAEALLEKAELAYSYLKNNPEPHFRFDEGQDSGSGPYDKHTDKEDRYWAAAELFKTTGDSQYESDLLANETYHAELDFPSWKDISALGHYAYATASGAQADKQAAIKSAFLAYADDILTQIEADGYYTSLLSTEYTWASAKNAITKGNMLLMAHTLDQNENYVNGALEQVHYILGRNATGYSYLTGSGTKVIQNLHNRLMKSTGAYIPGLLAGGPNNHGGDPELDQLLREANPAPAKAYLDVIDSYASNEYAIDYTAPVFFALSYFTQNEQAYDDGIEHILPEPQGQASLTTDYTQFFTGKFEGGGSTIEGTLEADGRLKVDYFQNAGGWMGVNAILPEDWTGIKGIRFTIAGNTGDEVRVEFQDGYDVRWEWIVTDDSAAGKEVTLLFDDIVKRSWQPDGAPVDTPLTLEVITGITLTPLDGEGTMVFSDMYLIGDGSTAADESITNKRVTRASAPAAQPVSLASDASSTVTGAVYHNYIHNFTVNEMFKDPASIINRIVNPDGSVAIDYQLAPGGYLGVPATIEEDWSSFDGFEITVQGNTGHDVRIELVDRDGASYEKIITDDSAVGKTWLIPFAEFAFRTDYNPVPDDEEMNLEWVKGINISPLSGSGTITFSNMFLYEAADVDIPSIGGHIKVNQVGYLPNFPKKAMVVNTEGVNTFHIVDINQNQIVYTGNLGQEIDDFNSGDKVRHADFTDFNQPGSYYLVVAGYGISLPFEIHLDVYRKPYMEAVRTYTLARANIELKDPWTGLEHAMAHQQDAEAKMYFTDEFNEKGDALDMLGGWYDAGDYGKYMTPGAVTAAQLLLAYELNSEKFSKGQFVIPEGLSTVERQTDLPDILVEVKYKLDFLNKMQRPDGAVYHKVSGKDWPGMSIAPEHDQGERYIYGMSTYGTAMYAATLAMASRAYESFDAAYAEDLLDRAKLAFTYLEANPEPFFRNDAGQDSGSGAYDKYTDSEERFWAAAELFKTTGDQAYEQYLIDHLQPYMEEDPDIPGWTNGLSLGHFAYATTEGAQEEHQTLVRETFLNYANEIVAQIEAEGYHTSLLTEEYTWASSKNAIAKGSILLLANELEENEAYVQGALEQVHYILGRNAIGNSYLIGAGTKSTRNPHSRMINSTGTLIPGLLVGGPNIFNNSGDPDLVAFLEANPGIAPAKAYVDQLGSFASNEYAIDYVAPVVLALTYFTGLQEEEPEYELPEVTGPGSLTKNYIQYFTATFEGGGDTIAANFESDGSLKVDYQYGAGWMGVTGAFVEDWSQIEGFTIEVKGDTGSNIRVEFSDGYDVRWEWIIQADSDDWKKLTLRFDDENFVKRNWQPEGVPLNKPLMLDAVRGVTLSPLDGEGTVYFKDMYLIGEKPKRGGSGGGSTAPATAGTATVTDLNADSDGKIIIELDSDIQKVLLPADAWNKDNKLVLKRDDFEVEVDGEVLEELLSLLAEEERDGANISFEVSVLLTEEAEELIQQAEENAKAKLKAVSAIYDFQLSIVDKHGNAKQLQAFKKPVRITLTLTEEANKDLIGMYYISDDSSIEYAGGTEASGKLSAGVNHFSKYAALEFDKSFADVHADYWAHDVIKKMAAKHIVAGISDTEFAPKRNVTRAEFVALIVRALGLEANAGTSFLDVDASRWYAKEIAAAYEAGIITGRSDTEFAPHATITREEMAVVLVKAYELQAGQSTALQSNTAFADASSISAWALDSVQTAQALGLLHGRDRNQFAPKAAMNRAESAQAIWQLLQ